jgi:hypothetical protein
MARVGPVDTLDIAILPLADDRHVMVPMGALAEVRQVNFAGRPPGDLGELSWRGYELSITSLDHLLGFPEPPPGRLNTVGIFKADKDSSTPFRALAFSGIASPGRIESLSLDPVNVEVDEHFLGATQMHDRTYLIPNLQKLLFDKD